jgi:FMN reductase (NADPH)
MDIINQQSAIDTLLNHVSIRQYTDEPISDDILQMILDSARRAPTSSNTQSYSIIVVRDADIKAKLAEFSGNQQQVIDCPVFLLFNADLSLLKRAAELHETTLAVNTELTLVSSIDAALVGMSAATAAESVGLGTVMIGGIRNHPEEVAELLGLPDGAYVVFGLCVGWPEVIPPQKPRLPEQAIVHYERHGAATSSQEERDQLLHDYDEALATHYREQGRQSPDAAWTGVIAKQFSQPRRTFMKTVLEKLGMSFS